MNEVRFIQAFCSRHRLSFEENASVLWCAIQDARRQVDATKGSLSTLATILMRRAVGEYDGLVRVPKTTLQRRPELRDRWRRFDNVYDAEVPEIVTESDGLRISVDDRWPPREQEILGLVGLGLSNQQIATSLGVSAGFVGQCVRSAVKRYFSGFNSRKKYWRKQA